MQHRNTLRVQALIPALGKLSPVALLVGFTYLGPVALARTTATQLQGPEGFYELPKGATPKLGLADVNTRIVVPPPKDLLLEKSGKSRSEALTHFALGSILQDSGEESRAMEHYVKVLDLDPKQFDLANRVAAILVRRGDVPKALNVLKDSIKANPKEPSTYRFLSFLYHRHQKKTDQAITYAQKAISIAPGNFDTHATLYDIYESEGESDKAYWVLRNAATLDVADGEFWVQLGKALRNHLMTHPSDDEGGDNDRLNDVFAKAEEKANENISLLDQVATYYVTSRQIDKAVALYRRILELDGSVIMVREKLAEALLSLGKRVEAIQILEGTAQIDPYRYDNMERLANLHFEGGNFEDALKFYLKCIQLNPHSWEMYVTVARLQAVLGKPEEALETVAQARERFADNDYFIYMQAIMQSEAERFDEALESFAEAEVRMQESRRNLVNASFYFEYGATAERAKKYDRAAELFRRSISMEPDFHRAYNYLGYMWIDANTNLEEAAALVRRALELDPGNSAYLDSLGWYHYRKGEYAEALELLQESASKLTEPSWEIHDHLGDTYDKLGRREEALAEWSLAYSLDLENDVLRAKLPPEVAKRVEQEVAAKHASDEAAKIEGTGGADADPAPLAQPEMQPVSSPDP